MEKDRIVIPDADGSAYATEQIKATFATRRSMEGFLIGLAEQLESEDEQWRQKANCLEVDKSLMYPSDYGGTIKAQQVCEDCPVQPECLEYALENNLADGVWGGVSERGRKQILKARGLNKT